MGHKRSAVGGGASTKLGGKPYRQVVAQHVANKFAEAGLKVYEEVPLGSSIIGKDRRLDILVLSEMTGKAAGLRRAPPVQVATEKVMERTSASRASSPRNALHLDEAAAASTTGRSDKATPGRKKAVTPLS